MPIDSRGMNSDFIKPFELEEYVSRIKLMPRLLEHLQATSCDFDDYMKKLSTYDEEYIVNYWIYLLYQELKSNQRIENTKFDITTLVDKSVFFETLNITHKRIHELHNFVVEKEIAEGKLVETFDYRSVPVNVSSFDENGNEQIFWRGVNPEDVHKFMNDFIKIYKQGGTSLLFGNPFLASSLMHLLFVKVHPYRDGNGRTARVIHNIKFTEMINKLYGTRLKLSPLNLSSSIYVNKITYVKRINNIYFDVEHDTNEAINRWFDFMLDMVDERLYVATSMLDRIDVSKMRKVTDEEDGVKGMRLSRIR